MLVSWPFGDSAKRVMQLGGKVYETIHVSYKYFMLRQPRPRFAPPLDLYLHSFDQFLSRPLRLHRLNIHLVSFTIYTTNDYGPCVLLGLHA